MAILYKDVDGVMSVGDRAELFKNKMTADIAMPASFVINSRLITHIQAVQKAYSEKP